ncbi:MAG: hypothetical protein J6A02_08595 [Prevotella sp.]|nr:hypothetical protein [Prevotella sp.]
MTVGAYGGGVYLADNDVVIVKKVRETLRCAEISACQTVITILLIFCR